MKAGLPVALPSMRIGLLGGSFDPAHSGHVLISEVALRKFGLQQVWWLVSPGNPLKARAPAPLAQRLATARQLVHNPAIRVTDLEKHLNTRLTADTITALQKAYSGASFVWLMGSDNMVQFSRWERWRDIVKQVPVGVLARPETRLAARQSRTAQILRHARLRESDAKLLPLMRPPAWVLVNLPMTRLSSTEIRAHRVIKQQKMP